MKHTELRPGDIVKIEFDELILMIQKNVSITANSFELYKDKVQKYRQALYHKAISIREHLNKIKI